MAHTRRTKRKLAEDEWNAERRRFVARDIERVVLSMPELDILFVEAFWGRDFNVTVKIKLWTWIGLGLIHVMMRRRILRVVTQYFEDRYDVVPRLRVAVT
jgi:hypothetical protein